MEDQNKKLKSSSPLHPCSEIPSNQTTVEKDCLNDLVNYYNVINYLGHGVYGVTLYIKRNEHNLAIKILEKNNDTINEIKAANRVNIVKHLTSIFVNVHGWILCKGIPDEWNERIPWQKVDVYNHIKKLHTNKNTNFLYLIMDIYPIEFFDFEMFSEIDLIKILFILLHGLIMIKTEFPHFKHGDIHAGNVMIQEKNNEEIKLEFPYLENAVIIKNVRYFPKLIDFGMTEFENNDNNDDDDKNDLDNIFDIIFFKLQEKFPYSKYIKKLDKILSSQFFEIDSDNYTNNNKYFIQVFTSMLFENSLFKNIYTIYEEKQGINQKICSRCNINSTKWHYDHSKDYLFCSKECADVFDIFKNYFPIK
jgi:hypothetical protein